MFELHDNFINEDAKVAPLIDIHQCTYIIMDIYEQRKHVQIVQRVSIVT